MKRMQLTVFIALLTVASTATAAETNLQLVERATTNTIAVHAGHAADNTGDILTFTNDVFDAANTKKLGFDQGYCVRLIAGKSWECHFTILLANSQLSIDGPFLDQGDTAMAVTGGTGIYRDARGDLVLHARDAKGSAYDYSIRLK